MPNYREICRVTLEHAGLPVKLLLQRVTNRGPFDCICLSWRTPWPSGLANRRFYDTSQDGFWRIPVSVALELLNLADAEGMLDQHYDDPQVRHGGARNRIIYSRDLDRQDYKREWDSIFHADLDHAWGPDSVFVIIQVPDGTWRKIMIVDTEKAICTFRSTTIDDSYSSNMKLTGGLTPPWQLDRSMQDASSAMMRKFRQALLSV